MLGRAVDLAKKKNGYEHGVVSRSRSLAKKKNGSRSLAKNSTADAFQVHPQGIGLK